ncbi:MAG: hypothetical protein LUD47_00460 [Clostridia bacterium]|nr:hypothetical protein [Clostridia bacterium]
MRHDFETRKEKIYDYIVDWHVDFGRSPSYRQIMKDTGTPSMQTVYAAVKALKEDGRIDIDAQGRIVVPESEDAGEEVKARIIDTAFCGIPDYSDANIRASVRLPVSLFGSDEKFLMKADGDSMVERGIYDGDLLVVHPHGTVRPGAVVIVHIEGSYMCKEYCRERGREVYRSANHLPDGSPKYKDLVPDEWNPAEILGTVDETIHFVNRRLDI